MSIIVELAVAALACVAPQDLELRGVRVVTGTGDAWAARSIAVQDGRIAGVEAGDAAERFELAGHAWVYPGFVDAHAHLVGLGRALEEVDLVGTTSYAEVVRRVRERAETLPAGSWVLGRGWDQNDWEDARLPTHEELSSNVPDHPVVLRRIDGHALLANDAAMRAASVTDDVESPSGGEVVREDGRPTGVFVDRAMALVQGAVPESSEADLERWLLAAQAECLRLGLTCVHDAGLGPDALAVVRRLHTQGRWMLRTYAMLPASATDAIQAGPWQTPDRLVSVRAVKGYADGALGSRGAALLEGYADRPDWKGLLITPPAGLRKLAQLCADRGFQLCVHAIGDAANRAVLDAYEATEFRGPPARARFRIEHAQVVHPDDFVRFADLGVIPSMQPTHLTSDMP